MPIIAISIPVMPLLVLVMPLPVISIWSLVWSRVVPLLIECRPVVFVWLLDGQEVDGIDLSGCHAVGTDGLWRVRHTKRYEGEE
jgi:hypothetical protein